MKLWIAHCIVDNFERKIREKIPIIKQITTHIEAELNTEKIIGSEQSVNQELLENIKKIVLSITGVVDCKNISVTHIGNDMQIAFTIKLDKSYNQSTRGQIVSNRISDISIEDDKVDLTIDEAHAIATKVQ